jgi:hypothetical protein
MTVESERPPQRLIHRPRSAVITAKDLDQLVTYTVCGLPIGEEHVAVVGRGEAVGQALCPVCWPRR